MNTLAMPMPSASEARVARAHASTRTGLHWSDWSLSVLLHGGLALLYLLWVQETLSDTLTPPADIAITWAAPAPPPPVTTPPPPPEPPPPPPKKVTPRAPVPSTSRPVAPPTVSAASAVEMPSVQPEPPQAAKPSPEPAPAVTQAAVEPPKPVASTAAADWRQFLQAYMRKHKAYPMSARRMRQQGTVVVEASFSESGEVLLCTVASGSGYTSLDQAALALVQNAATATRTTIQPGMSLQIRIPVVYELQDI